MQFWRINIFLLFIINSEKGKVIRKRYYDYLKELIEIAKLDETTKEIFNPLKFKEQFLQSAAIFEEYLLTQFEKKIVLGDMFGGIGTYGLFFALNYPNLIKKIYVTEKHKESYEILRNLIGFFSLQDKITPVLIDKKAGFDPYKNKII